jgi:hypothetical protein
MRNKAINVVRLSNGKEIRTENVAEINSNMIKAEVKAITIRTIIEQYKLLYRTWYQEEGEVTTENELSDVNEFDRIRVNLAQNVRSNIIVLEEGGTDFKALKVLKKGVENYIDYAIKPEIMSEKTEQELNELVVETLETPYREWMMKEKTKIRYNYAEDAKRTWNSRKQTCEQAKKIKTEIFKEHYEKNWANVPQEINIEENSMFLMQRKLVFKDDEMVKFLLDKQKMIKAIATKVTFQGQGLTNSHTQS